MAFIDFILNITGLLLWLNWRATRSTGTTKPPAISLLSTLRRVEMAGAKRWLLLVGLIGVLLLRAPVYWWIGPGAGWTPQLPLNVVAIPFRSDLLDRMLIFSFLSFGLALAAFYLWLLLLSMVNRHVADTDPWQRMVRFQLGWPERWPLILKLVLPLCMATLLWLALAPLFKKLGIIPPPKSPREVWQQGIVFGLAAYLIWKYLVAGVLLLYLVNSHLYLGTNPFWNYANVTARNLLAPLRGLPLHLGRVDFAPLVAVALVFLIDGFSSRGLVALFHRLPI
jgi:uncharacterized protein YggT (Ycf19 family)